MNPRPESIRVAIHCRHRGRYVFPFTTLFLSLVLTCEARADAYDAEFRPGPSVPKGFKPGPGVDASGMDLSGSEFIGLNLEGADFSRCVLKGARFLQVNLVTYTKNADGTIRPTGGVSFRGADLRDVVFEEPNVYEVCDFTDALINGITVTGGHTHFLSIEQLRSTKSYRIKDLSRCYIMGEWRQYGDTNYLKITLDLCDFDLEGATLSYADFTGSTFFDAKMNRLKLVRAHIEQRQLGDWSLKGQDGAILLRRSFTDFQFLGMDLRGWNFTDADLSGTHFNHVTLEGVQFSGADIRRCRFSRSISNDELRSTRSYHRGDLRGITFIAMDFSGFDLARMNLADVEFRSCNLAEADFTDSVITAATFRKCRNLTLAQIKSTWNYKHGRMAGIRLPEELAKALEQEERNAEDDAEPKSGSATEATHGRV